MCYEYLTTIKDSLGWKIDTSDMLMGILVNRHPDEYWDYGVGAVCFTVQKGKNHDGRYYIRATITNSDDGMSGAWLYGSEKKINKTWRRLCSITKEKIKYPETLSHEEMNKFIFNHVGMNFVNED